MWTVLVNTRWNICFPILATLLAYAALSMEGSGENGHKLNLKHVSSDYFDYSLLGPWIVELRLKKCKVWKEYTNIHTNICINIQYIHTFMYICVYTYIHIIQCTVCICVCVYMYINMYVGMQWKWCRSSVWLKIMLMGFSQCHLWQ